jgi:hypothetical protein
MDSSHSSATAAAPLPRLAEQLRVLSELTETLTYRLLELEERLASQELRIAPLLEGAAGDPAGAAVLQDEMELRLEDTEERLSRLEGVLSGLETPASGTPLATLEEEPEAALAPSEQESAEDQGWLDEEGVEESYPPFRRIA